MRQLRPVAPLVALIVAVFHAPPVQAQEVAQPGWQNSTELGWVVTTGNSETSNFNARNLFTYDWTSANLDWEFGYLRASSGDDRFAVGTEADFDIVQPAQEPDNDRLFTNIRYTRNINERFFWFGRFESTRDKPADIDHRFTPSAGAGNTWAKRDDLALLSGYGISYTNEELTLEGQRNFAGYQLFYSLTMQATASTRIESKLVFDGSLEDGSDVRFDWYNGAGVSVSNHIALKASLRLVYRNEPALEEIDLVGDSGLVIGTVVVPKEKLDTSFTTSLVINF